MKAAFSPVETIMQVACDALSFAHFGQRQFVREPGQFIVRSRTRARAVDSPRPWLKSLSAPLAWPP